MAKRNGLRRPQAKVSWHRVLPAVTVRPVSAQRSESAPWKGFVAGMLVLPSGFTATRRILPVSTFSSREASLLPAQPPPA